MSKTIQQKENTMFKFIVIINDCHDNNAMGRQSARCAALFGCNVTTVGVRSDLQAAGNLADMLDATMGMRGLIIVNVAPRDGKAKRWKNGTPFVYFWVGETLIIAPVDGLCLSLVKKLGIVTKYHLLDIPETMTWAKELGLVDCVLADQIQNTQFRSYEFIPRVALWIIDGHIPPSTIESIEQIPDAPPAVWYVDVFGNCKTTLLPEEIWILRRHEILGDLPHIRQLKSVSDQQAAIVTGSSGYGTKRFLEIMVQGGSASIRLSLKVGSLLKK
ncbi:MAG: hypothetical protein HYV41_04195 [Candidatus Magasanikbacteria bacterium]|nr:hypothetical protein [Candidatus Magasanikbacteria bacterium]